MCSVTWLGRCPSTTAPWCSTVSESRCTPEPELAAHLKTVANTVSKGQTGGCNRAEWRISGLVLCVATVAARGGRGCARQDFLADDKQCKIAVAQCMICIRTDKLLHLTGLGSSNDY